ncbi:spondin domain-containing protein [Sulfurirhabdus autotrophica]|uniref:Spondin N n=1 Tax=Sulfurirhabdus autotrophica TaxID=1706046 RepID=A0A4R3Y0J9_9PROT|nr:spondin domain-containing protein [Sulfurirhabdus autotrophica]TCV85186.1 spondin N [Sulfurirhabdus autotrophica]
MKKPLLSIMAAAITASAFFSIPATYADEGGIRHYAITITNITRGQIIAPPAVIAHNDDYKMFTLGGVPSYELAQLAEAGNGSLVLSAAASMPSVYKTVLGSGGILPGASQTIEIETTKKFPEISIGAMLATTNDGFMAIRGVSAPSRGSVTVEAQGYDAGSEANSDTCAFIPGPPCGDTNHNPAAPEGYVHVHEGIHSVSGGTLNAAQLDWRNPVAQIEIKRID